MIFSCVLRSEHLTIGRISRISTLGSMDFHTLSTGIQPQGSSSVLRTSFLTSAQRWGSDVIESLAFLSQRLVFAKGGGITYGPGVSR